MMPKKAKVNSYHSSYGLMRKPCAAQGFEKLLHGVMTTGIPYVAHELPSTIYRAGIPHQAYWNFVYQPLLDAEGLTTGVTVVATEASEQVQARQLVQHLNQELQAANGELHKSNQQLTRTNVDLDNFIYTASHDLKAPIANMKACCCSYASNCPLPCSRRE